MGGKVRWGRKALWKRNKGVKGTKEGDVWKERNQAKSPACVVEGDVAGVPDK